MVRSSSSQALREVKMDTTKSKVKVPVEVIG
jgi:hypothetical protein